MHKLCQVTVKPSPRTFDTTRHHQTECSCCWLFHTSVCLLHLSRHAYLLVSAAPLGTGAMHPYTSITECSIPYLLPL
eukprot:jgi/Chrzof1/11551/UNPLg00487.t1